MAMVDHLVNIRGTDALSVCATDLPEVGLVLNPGVVFEGKKPKQLRS